MDSVLKLKGEVKLAYDVITQVIIEGFSLNKFFEDVIKQINLCNCATDA